MTEIILDHIQRVMLVFKRFLNGGEDVFHSMINSKPQESDHAFIWRGKLLSKDR